MATAAVVLTACGADSEGTEGASTNQVRVTVSPGIGSLPFRVADTQGFFADHGLEVTSTEGFDAPTYIAGLDRQWDMAMDVTFSTTLAAGTGRQLKVFAGMEALGPDSLNNPVITNDPSVDDLGDLRGRTVALPRVGDPLEAQWSYYFDQQGIPGFDEIDFVAPPFATMADQLNANRVAAIESAIGYFEGLLDDPANRVVAPMPQAAVELTGAEFPVSYAAFVATPEYVEQNPETVEAFIAAIGDAEEWIDAHPDEARAEFVEWTGYDAAAAELIVFPPWKLEVTASDFEPWVEIYSDQGVLQSEVDPADLVIE